MFNAGDKVRAVKSSHVQITEGTVYEVKEVRVPYVYLVEGDKGKHHSWDGINIVAFKLAQNAEGIISLGEAVRISEEGRKFLPSSFYTPSGYVVKHLDPSDMPYVYLVQWSNGKTNSYRKEEIELAAPSVCPPTKEENVEEETKGENIMKNVIYTYSGDSATVVIEGKVSTITSNEGVFAALIEELKQPVHDVEKIKGLVDKKTAVEAYAKGKVNIRGGVVTYDGVEINDTLTDKMLKMMDEGFDIGPWVAFLENLMQNPSFNSRKCLFNFLEQFQAPFTPDGCFIAFKRVDQNFKDLRTHTMDNSPGTVVKMNRSDVDDNPKNTCSSGLHCAASSYLDSYANSSYAKTIMLKVNPKDVVAVPEDYNFAKMRVCEYEVLADITVDQMKDYESQTVVETWEGTDEDASQEWDLGDFITFTGEHNSVLVPGEEYEIVQVDVSDRTVLVSKRTGGFVWLNFDGTYY